MVKIFTVLFLLLVLSSEKSIAQQNLLLKYIGRDIKYTQASDLFGVLPNGRYSINSPDVEIYSSRTSKFLLDRTLHKNITGARIIVRDTDFTATIEQLKNYPSLQFITLPGTLATDYRFHRFILPDNINQLQQLEGVEIAYPDANLFEIIPKLKSIKKLSAISISLVKRSLPKELLDLKHIRSIGLNSINIRDLNISNALWENVFYDGSNTDFAQLNADLTKLSKLRSLKHLELFACNLGDDISMLSKLKHLKSFKISGTTFGNKLQLFQRLAALQNLEALSVRFLKDSVQVLDGLEKLKALRQLTIEDMSSMKIIPVNIGNLSKLKTLTIFNSPIKDLPLSVFQLPNLERLELSTPQLVTLPDGDFNCKKLKSINISYAKLNKIPNAITTLTNLEDISFVENQISQIPENGWQKLTQLKKIDLSNNRITIFPGGLQQISGLRSMALGGNLIDSLPDLSQDNYQLTYLDVSRNNLKSLPMHIGNYDQLEMLYIGQNMLSGLPASLGNCTKLRVLDAEVQPVLVGSDFVFDGKMHINALPNGLQNAPNLEFLRLSGNKGIDGNSVFNVILSMPRPNLILELNDIDLTAIPASPKWKDISISRLVLSNNKLTTLPVEFASIKKIGTIKLYGNPFPGMVSAITTRDIRGKSDLKVLYYDIGVPFPDNMVTASEYAASLTKLSSQLYSPGEYNKAIKFANMALATDSATYSAYAQWDVIGTCRYYTKDYKGAIPDFERFIVQMDKEKTTKLEGLKGVIGYYKANSHIQLGQLEQALQTHQYFAKRYNEPGAKQSVAVIYKAMGRQQQYQQMMDSAMTIQLNAIELAKKRNNEVGIAILDHAETLIIAGRQNEAIKLLDYEQKGYSSYDYFAIREYLLATANYLADPSKFDQLKNALTTYYQTHGKVLYWDFEMFNSWVKLSVKDPIKLAQLMELEDISKYKEK